MSEIVTEEYCCETCCKCGVKFWMPKAVREVARIRGLDEFLFWCPNGHSQGYERKDEDDPDGGEERENDEGEVVRFPVVKGGLS